MDIQVSRELTLAAPAMDLLRCLGVEPSQEHFGVGIASASWVNKHFEGQ